MDNNSSSPFLFYYRWSQSSGSWRTHRNHFDLRNISFPFSQTIKRISEKFVFVFPTLEKPLTKYYNLLICLPKLSLNSRVKEKYFNNAAWRFTFRSNKNFWSNNWINIVEKDEKYLHSIFNIYTKNFTQTFGDYLWTN